MRPRIEMRGVRRLAAIVAAQLVTFAGVAAALPPERDWDLGIGLYGWMPAPEMKARGRDRVTGDRITRDFHKDLDEAIGDWDGGGGGYVDARWHRFVGFVDAAWVQNDYNSDGYQTSTLVDAMVGYRVLDIERPFSSATGPDAPRLHLDLLAGARYHEADANVDDSPGETFDYDQSRDWFSPIFGLRTRVELVKNLTLGAVFDIGGFDVGQASHLTWSLNPRLNYRAFDHLDLFIGWRHLADDHDGDREVNLSGPQAGIGYSF